jgi:hypothetical protein
VTTFKSEQRRIIHRGREFHFVSYEGRLASERRNEKALPPMWFLMSEGKRCPVMPIVPDQDAIELDKALIRWVDTHAFAPKEKTRRQA